MSDIHQTQLNPEEEEEEAWWLLNGDAADAGGGGLHQLQLYASRIGSMSDHV